MSVPFTTPIDCPVTERNTAAFHSGANTEILNNNADVDCSHAKANRCDKNLV